ncbi:hypothetical protein RRG08_037148 [Elysia crispata]|uniref:Uncharacterized protein n=1 Tax=Elysia crispata TaxID=231223 RepID=A0AAE1A5T9_9GAST|nr:hypothetical protein RRG08_037148 [Elysia crispata]
MSSSLRILRSAQTEESGTLGERALTTTTMAFAVKESLPHGEVQSIKELRSFQNKLPVHHLVFELADADGRTVVIRTCTRISRTVHQSEKMTFKIVLAACLVLAYAVSSQSLNGEDCGKGDLRSNKILLTLILHSFRHLTRLEIHIFLCLFITVSSQPLNGEDCGFCIDAADYLYWKLPKNPTRKQVEGTVSLGCQGLPYGVINTCWNMGAFHYDDLVNLMLQDKPAKEICVKYC